MKKRFAIAAAFLLQLTLSGCSVTMKNADKNIASDDQSTIVVIGVSRAAYVDINPETIENGQVDKDKKEGTGFRVGPEKEYVVLQLPERSGERGYGISSFQSDKETGSRSYDRCNWGGKLFFEAKRGKVIYIGDIDFPLLAISVRTADLTMLGGYKVNEEQARAFINANYPRLSGLLEYQPPRYVKMPWDDCGRLSAPQVGSQSVPMYFPVYIRKR